MREVIIDVREKNEYAAERVGGSINLPLTDISHLAPGVLGNLGECKIVLMCRSGKRAALARQELEGMGMKFHFETFEGGIEEWKRQGKPTEGARKAPLPIMRQVQIVAGLLVLTGTLLAYFVSPVWLALTGFVGAGLMVAGLTGFCGMAEILCRMPWNK